MQKFNSNIYFLLFNSLDQKSLRLEKYIHLRDAISKDRNIIDIEKIII